MTTRRLALSLAAFASLSGCGDDLPRQARDGGDVIDAAPLCIQLDAGPASACWPEELPDPSPEVRVEIGTGLIDFRPLPDAFEIACTDAQTGCYMAINARVSGIMPGDPKNPLCPSNPRTRAYVTLEETGELVGGNDRIRCVQRGYTATDTPGTYEMDDAYSWSIDDPPSLFQQEVRVTVEVLDHLGRYGKAEEVVTAVPYPGWADAGPL
ncbi:MAG TPA: hypothetical protein VKZ63_21620 [Kofleriaceae bacterium]|nr:hypothetical protein [Kofleriaceae bacterium]